MVINIKAEAPKFAKHELNLDCTWKDIVLTVPFHRSYQGPYLGTCQLCNVIMTSANLSSCSFTVFPFETFFLKNQFRSRHGDPDIIIMSLRTGYFCGGGRILPILVEMSACAANWQSKKEIQVQGSQPIAKDKCKMIFLQKFIGRMIV